MGTCVEDSASSTTPAAPAYTSIFLQLSVATTSSFIEVMNNMWCNGLLALVLVCGAVTMVQGDEPFCNLLGPLSNNHDNALPLMELFCSTDRGQALCPFNCDLMEDEFNCIIYIEGRLRQLPSMYDQTGLFDRIRDDVEAYCNQKADVCPFNCSFNSVGAYFMR